MLQSGEKLKKAKIEWSLKSYEITFLKFAEFENYKKILYHRAGFAYIGKKIELFFLE